jgi:hypothetical protein
MTAPLPPIASVPREYHAEVMDYAKLAVREALERVRAWAIAHECVEPSDIGSIFAIPEQELEVMLKEYSDD